MGALWQEGGLQALHGRLLNDGRKYTEPSASGASRAKGSNTGWVREHAVHKNTWAEGLWAMQFHLIRGQNQGTADARNKALARREWTCHPLLRCGGVPKGSSPHAAHSMPPQELRGIVNAWAQGAIARPSSLAFTIEGAASGMSSKGPSTNGSTSGLFHAGWPCRVAATLQAASVACSSGGEEKRGKRTADGPGDGAVFVADVPRRPPAARRTSA